MNNSWYHLKLFDNHGGVTLLYGTEDQMTCAYDAFKNAKQSKVNDLLEIEGCTDELNTTITKFIYTPDDYIGAFLTCL